MFLSYRSGISREPLNNYKLLFSLILLLNRLLEHIPELTVGAYEGNVFQAMKNRSRKFVGRKFCFYIFSNHLFYFFPSFVSGEDRKFSTIFIFRIDVSLLTRSSSRNFNWAQITVLFALCIQVLIFRTLAPRAYTAPSTRVAHPSASGWKKTRVAARMRSVSLLIVQTGRREMLEARIMNCDGVRWQVYWNEVVF